MAFDHAATQLEYFPPPLFSDVRVSLKQEISDYIARLPLSGERKKDLLEYYEKVWSLVDSGQINLELDLHFIFDNDKFNVDLKSGFRSNEKGNTNRLLMVATIYRNIESGYRCLLLVRAPEDQNNHYFKTLRYSGVWETYCGADAYAQIKTFTGVDLKAWIEQNIDWMGDFTKSMTEHLKANNLHGYLHW